MMTPSANERALAQSRELPLHISKELCSGGTYIVTGANVGLGMEACRHLLAVDTKKVILGVRNVKAGEEAKKVIEESTGVTGVAEVWQLDLASYASVKAFAHKAITTLDRIDGIIENAAIATASDELAEGHKIAFTVNVISTLLLGVLLLPKLRANAAKYGITPRIAIVSSGVGFDVGPYWPKVADDPIAKMDADPELGFTSYPTSKLMEILAVREIKKILPVSRGKVIVNVINPGLCETTLIRNGSEEVQKNIKDLWAKCSRTAECGSRTLLAGVVAGEESHGTYMDSCYPAEDHVPDWVNDTVTKQAWDSIVRELEQIEPGCVEKAFK